MGHPEPWNLTWMAIGNEVNAACDYTLVQLRVDWLERK